MAKKNIFDIASDQLKGRLDKAFAILSEDYKGKNPYRKEPVKSEDSLYQYNQLINSPGFDREEVVRDFGPAWLRHEQDMEKIQRRFR